MTDFFDWHSDDEDAWDSPIQTAGEAGNRRSIDRLQKVIVIATAVLLFLLLAIPVRQGANQVIDSTTFGRQSELLAANQLVLEAALAGDVELFSQLVSRRDMQWYSDQRVIARRQLLLDRAPLAIWLDRPALEASDAPFRDATVTLAPDLTSAEVSTTLPYLTLTAGGNLESIRLTRTDQYIRLNDRWILVSAADQPLLSRESEVAGPANGETYQGEILTLHVPERDREIGRRLAADVDAMLARLCRQLTALSCAPGSSFEATLSADPSSLFGLDRAFLLPRYRTYLTRSIRTVDDIILPAPGLVGAPADEAGYQALFRGYGAWLATAFVYHQIDPAELSNDRYLAFLADEQLVPPPPGEHNPLLALEPPPAPFPNQKAQLHCSYSSGRSELWSYDPRNDTWSDETDAAPRLSPAIGVSAQGVVSPDGRWVAAESEVNRAPVIDLRHLDGRLVRRLPDARDPFWLDQQRLGYTRVRRLPLEEQPAGATLAVTESDLVVITLDGALTTVAETVLTSDQLRQAVTLHPQPQGLRISDVTVSPGSGAYLYILARAASGLHDAYLFAVDEQLAAVEFLDRWRDNGTSDMPLHITDDGRFLTVTRYGFSRTYISIYDVDRRQRQMVSVAGRPGARFDWSDDQQWLAIASDRLLWLIAPGLDYATTIPHNIAGCWSVTWAAAGVS